MTAPTYAAETAAEYRERPEYHEETAARLHREKTEEELPCCSTCHEPLSVEEIGDEQDEHESCCNRRNAKDRLVDALDTLYHDALEQVAEFDDEQRKGYYYGAPDLGVEALVAKLREVMLHATVSKPATVGLTATLEAMAASDNAR